MQLNVKSPNGTSRQQLKQLPANTEDHSTNETGLQVELNTKPVDVAAVLEAEAVIERIGEEVTAAAMIGVLAETLRTNGKAVLLSDNSFGKQILEFKLAADNLRALSAAPTTEAGQ
jgi:hypothetical protein